MSKHPNSANLDKRIDATLRLFAQTQPPADFERRIHARLHREPAHPRKHLAARFSDFFFAQRIIFVSAAAALGCCAIVIGSVQHSHQRTLPATGIHISAPGSGLGAASGARIASEPVVAPEHAHSRSERKATGGRATVPRDTHKPKGVGVPASTTEKP